MLETYVSTKGQVTVPKSVREALGLKIGDRVIFVPDGPRAILFPLGKGTAGLKGVFKDLVKGKKPVDFKKLRQEAKRHTVKTYWSHRHGDPK